jgi:hypothetical protein
VMEASHGHHLDMGANAESCGYASLTTAGV